MGRVLDKFDFFPLIGGILCFQMIFFPIGQIGGGDSLKLIWFFNVFIPIAIDYIYVSPILYIIPYILSIIAGVFGVLAGLGIYKCKEYSMRIKYTRYGGLIAFISIPVSLLSFLWYVGVSAVLHSRGYSVSLNFRFVFSIGILFLLNGCILMFYGIRSLQQEPKVVPDTWFNFIKKKLKKEKSKEIIRFSFFGTFTAHMKIYKGAFAITDINIYFCGKLTLQSSYFARNYSGKLIRADGILGIIWDIPLKSIYSYEIIDRKIEILHDVNTENGDLRKESIIQIKNEIVKESSINKNDRIDRLERFLEEII